MKKGFKDHVIKKIIIFVDILILLCCFSILLVIVRGGYSFHIFGIKISVRHISTPVCLLCVFAGIRLSYIYRNTLSIWLERCLNNRKNFIIYYLITITFIIIFVNYHLNFIDYNSKQWVFKSFLSILHPFGIDYNAVYNDARGALHDFGNYVPGNIIYPPFNAVLNIPTALFPYNIAYTLQIILLYLINIIVVFMIVNISFAIILPSFRVSQSDEKNYFSLLKIIIIVLFSFLQVMSYGFLFSIERGNCDIYALFFCILALWQMIKRPSNIWMQCLFISIAVHIKLYPVILMPLLLWLHRRKSILPLITINIFLLFILGPKVGFNFIKGMISFSQEPYVWIGNHSAFSYVMQTSSSIFSNEQRNIIYTYFPIILWCISIIALFKRGLNSTNILLYFLASIFLMSILPTTSHDYKLVIQIFPILALSSLFILNFVKNGNSNLLSVIYLIFLTFVMFILLNISRSYVNPFFAENKYPFILILQIFSTFIIVFYNKLFKASPV